MSLRILNNNLRGKLPYDLRDEFDDLLDCVEQDGYDDGYNEGFSDAEEKTFASARTAHDDKLRERLNYLKLGGGFHRETTGDLYIQGFLDAMATLGVKP